MTVPIAPQWLEREPPLEIAGALVGRNAAAQALDRLTATTIDPRLRVSRSDDWLLIVGPESCLPWMDDVTWLGRDGPLFTPTNYRPDLPPDLVARALKDASGIDGFCIVTPSHSFVAPVPHSAPSQQVLAELSTALAPRQAQP